MELLNTGNKLIQYIRQLMGGWPVTWGKYDRMTLAKNYERNAYVYAIINKIVTAMGNIRYMVVKDKEDGTIEELKDDDLVNLIKSPNKLQWGKEFFDTLYRNYLIYGESFAYGNRHETGNNAGKIDMDGLLNVNPEIVDIKVDAGYPASYYIGGSFERKIDVRNMLHVKNYNPDWKDAHGLPIVKAAGKLIDKLNAADEVEVRNYQNGGPAWFVSAKDKDSFEETQYTNFIDRIKKLWSKDENKGSVVGTSGAVDLHHVGKSPADLGVQESVKSAVQMLCAAFGLDPGTFDLSASTYNNKLIIEKTIYTGVGIPLAEKFAAAITHWLGESYGGVRVEVDTTSIDILSDNKKELVEWMTLANVFTDNEIREAVSYDRITGDDMDKTPSQRNDNSLNGFDSEALNEEVIQ